MLQVYKPIDVQLSLTSISVCRIVRNALRIRRTEIIVWFVCQ